ncbi:M56 family metallopeptidase [Aquisphaera insulae]|uniref:M56 family metallopeptidase n=1 Tax=Aquisphaera insulae TaxID=2712864 RepID=UPI0013ED128E|nr:M56 family metallopeptidase [Aquisphaera insulae]
MTSTLSMTSPAWTAAGWTMVHLCWIGAIIGAGLVAVRRLLGVTSPELRHAAAVAGLALWMAAPFAVFAWLYRPMPRVATEGVAAAVKVDAATVAVEVGPGSGPPPEVLVETHEPSRGPDRSRFEGLIGWLPGVWLAGSLATLGLVLAGVIGVEGLRRSSVRLEHGPVAECCRRLGESMGIARTVGVAACERVVAPVLVGVVRPLILLPPAALSGWTMDQVEMALLHELAHLRRHDNLVMFAQRLAEALLFFHPLTWWLSGWIGLEREICCDRLVVDRTGRRGAYAEFLAALAGAGAGGNRMVLAMANRPLTTRIRWILNREERSMRLTLTEGIGLVLAAVLGGTLTLATHAAPPPKEAADEAARQMLRRMADEVKATPATTGKEGDPRGGALVNIAEAQVKIGDREGALGTLRLLDSLPAVPLPKLGGKFDAQAWGRSLAVVESIEVRRDAGDLKGARAAFKRMTADFRVLDDKVVRSAFEKVSNEIDTNLIASKDESPHQLSDEEAGFVAEMWPYMIEQAIVLGETTFARSLIHQAVEALGPPQGPTKIVCLGTLGGYLMKAGDPTGGRQLIEKSRKAARGIWMPRPRAFAMSHLAEAMFTAGEVDEAIAMVRDLRPEDQQRVSLRMLDELAQDGFRAVMFDPGGMNPRIGDPWRHPKDPARVREGLPRIAEAVRAFPDVKARARTLISVAHLQARVGDFAGALATADAIPNLHRADFPGPSDGYYDAIRPAAFALIAAAMNDAGDQAAAASTFAKAEALARGVSDDGQKLIAQIMVAGQEAASRRDAALALTAEAIAVALKQPEPRRSRALSMLAEVQVNADDVSAAERTIEAIRDTPGLEKSRAQSVVIHHLDKKGDKAAAASLARRALTMLEAKVPEVPKSSPRKGTTELAINPNTFFDFDKELEPAMVLFSRATTLEQFRAQAQDATTTIRQAKELPAPRRETALKTVALRFASSGNHAEALDAVRAIDSPAGRMAAFMSLAYSIPESRRTVATASQK